MAIYEETNKHYCNIFFIIIFVSPAIVAHIPYLEHNGFTLERPFIVKKGIQQSIAVYSWLIYDGINPSKYIDVYTFKIKESNTSVYIELIGSIYNGFYENFVPWLALIGPNLHNPNQEVSFNIPNGYRCYCNVKC